MKKSISIVLAAALAAALFSCRNEDSQDLGWIGQVDEVVPEGKLSVPFGLWSGEQVFYSNWSVSQEISASECGQAEAGDVIQVTVRDRAAAKIQIEKFDWHGEQDEKWIAGLGGEMEKAGYSDVTQWSVDSYVAEMIKSNGFKVKGVNFTLLKVELKHHAAPGTGGNPYTQLWTNNANPKEPINWNDGPSKHFETIPTAEFASVNAGDTLRFKFAGSADGGAQLQYCLNVNGNWGGQLTGTGNVGVGGATSCDLTLTEEQIAAIKGAGSGSGDGLIVAGIGFTLAEMGTFDYSKPPLLVCEVDKSCIKAWEKNESPKVTVTARNYQGKNVETDIDLKLKTDKGDDWRSDTKHISLADGEQTTVTFDLMDTAGGKKALVAGFYNLSVDVAATYKNICSYNIGYDPTGVKSDPDAQSDFDSYWKGCLAKLKAIPVNATVVKEIKERPKDVPEDNFATTGVTRKIYLIEMDSVPNGATGSPIKIHGFLAVPTAACNDGNTFSGAKKYPVLISYQGYDNGGPGNVWIPGNNSDAGWVEFRLSSRGQVIDNRKTSWPEYYSASTYNSSNGYEGYKFGDKDAYYYRGAFMDVVRAVDYVKTLPCVDTGKMFATGSSQGGAFTIVAAALTALQDGANGRSAFKAVAPGIQFLGDYPDYFQIVPWPANTMIKAAEGASMSTSEKGDMFKFLSYYDTKNMAPKITCAFITAMGLQDGTCPPHTNFAPYNNLTQVAAADKEYKVNPFCGHDPGGDFTARYMAFFAKYMN